MDRDSVTLRDTPCSNKNIRSIREISTEQQTQRHTENTEVRGARCEKKENKKIVKLNASVVYR